MTRRAITRYVILALIWAGSLYLGARRIRKNARSVDSSQPGTQAAATVKQAQPKEANK